MIQVCKIPSPQAILIGFCIVTVKVLNSYKRLIKNGRTAFRILPSCLQGLPFYNFHGRSLPLLFKQLPICFELFRRNLNGCFLMDTA